MQWPTEKRQTAIYKTLEKNTKDQELPTRPKTGDDLMCSGRVSSSSFSGGTRRVTPVRKKTVISYE